MTIEMIPQDSAIFICSFYRYAFYLSRDPYKAGGIGVDKSGLGVYDEVIEAASFALSPS